jgi:hemerythrin-like domain-containing protein
MEETTMQHISIRIIKEEHDSLTAMLQSMLMMIRRGPLNEPELFFDVLRSMLFYIDEVPEKQHHPKESQYFFPLVAKRSPACADAIQGLEKEHHQGEATIRGLQHLLLAWEIMGDIRREAFVSAAQSYFDFYKAHMAVEEKQIIPEALKVLTEEDWSCVDAAFARNADPLSTSQPRDPIYDRLFSKITFRAPAPIGLGHS